MKIRRILTLLLAVAMCIAMANFASAGVVVVGELSVGTSMDGYKNSEIHTEDPFVLIYGEDGTELRNGYTIIGDDTVITVKNESNQLSKVVFCTMRAFKEQKNVTITGDDGSTPDWTVYKECDNAYLTGRGTFSKGEATVDTDDPNAAKLLLSGQTMTFEGGDARKVSSNADLFQLLVYSYDVYSGSVYSYDLLLQIDSEKAAYIVEGKNPEDPDNPFTDVPKDAYYHDPVLWALEERITTGMTDNTFAPNATCTRGQVATFLWRAKGCPEPETTENPFIDVSESDYYYKPILWAYENGITTGTSETTFSPNGTCTSAHVITFLWRANGEPEAKTEGTEYYAQAVAWATKNKLLEDTAVAFAPENLSPRSDIVTYLYRDAK